MSLKSVLKKILKPSKTKALGVFAFIMLSGGISLSLLSNVNASGSTVDCDPNAVVYCGAPSMPNLANDYSRNLQKINEVYASSPFNMDKASFDDFESNYVIGQVYRDGNIFVNGKRVATDAWTAGRIAMSNPKGSTVCSNQYENSDDIWVRQPACSFRSSPLEAFVYMPNGEFRFAVLKSCGNPVVATPVKKTPPPAVPNYTILKQVRSSGNNPFTTNITVQPDTKVEYKITVTNTGKADIKDIHVRDSLPANIEYVKDTLYDDGREMVKSDPTNFFNATGVDIPDLGPGQFRVFTFSAIVGPHNTPESCKEAVMDNVGVMWAIGSGLPTKVSHAYVNEACHKTPSTPTLVCSDLTDSYQTANSEGDTPYTFTATGSATNAKITEYVFDYYNGNTLFKSIPVKTSADTATTSYTFSPGTYSIIVRVMAQAGTRTLTATSPDCSKMITSSSQPLCTAPNGDTYPQGSAQCTPGTTSCTSNCTTSSTTALPNTGPGNVIAVGVGATGLGAIGRWFYLYRKAKRIGL